MRTTNKPAAIVPTMVPTGALFAELDAGEVAAAGRDTEDVVLTILDDELPLEPDNVETGTLVDALKSMWSSWYSTLVPAFVITSV
jgi:hypothetical protein